MRQRDIGDSQEVKIGGRGAKEKRRKFPCVDIFCDPILHLFSLGTRFLQASYIAGRGDIWSGYRRSQRRGGDMVPIETSPSTRAPGSRSLSQLPESGPSVRPRTALHRGSDGAYDMPALKCLASRRSSSSSSVRALARITLHCPRASRAMQSSTLGGARELAPQTRWCRASGANP